MSIWIDETWIDADRGCIFGESGIYETCYETIGDLYRALNKEYGRCISKQYIDIEGGKAKQIGWVFQGRQRYEDTHEPYLRETWVSVHAAPPTRTVEYHYHEFK